MAEPGTQYPVVTVIMPVFNEEPFIARSLEQVLAQDYPADRVEIIVVDGRSTDRTTEIVRAYQQQHPQIQLIDNPDRFRASGLNLAIQQSTGDILVCVDGHCEVSSDFVSEGVRLLQEHPEAWCVGGPTRHVGRNTFAKAAAVAMSQRVGVGTATHRFPGFEGYADGVQFPAYRRWIFDRVGLFDEAMVRTEDDELSFRILQAGGKVFVSPRVRYKYYVRDTLGKLFQQYVQYSFWRIPVFRKHARPTTMRQIVPVLFYLTMLVLLVAGIIWREPLLAVALPLAYVAVVGVVGLSTVPVVGLRVGLLVPLAILTMHAAYALGMVYGLFAFAFRPSAFERHGSMSQQSR